MTDQIEVLHCHVFHNNFISCSEEKTTFWVTHEGTYYFHLNINIMVTWGNPLGEFRSTALCDQCRDFWYKLHQLVYCPLLWQISNIFCTLMSTPSPLSEPLGEFRRWSLLCIRACFLFNPVLLAKWGCLKKNRGQSDKIWPSYVATEISPDFWQKSGEKNFSVNFDQNWKILFPRSQKYVSFNISWSKFVFFCL